MGKTPTKKKATKRRRAKPAARPNPIAAEQRATIDAAMKVLDDLLPRFGEHMAAVQESGEVTQDDMAAALLFERLQDLAKAGRSSFNDAVLAIYDKGAGDLRTEKGAIALTIGETTRVSPAWKKEAERREEALRTLARGVHDGSLTLTKVKEMLKDWNIPFDSKTWDAAIKKACKPSTSYAPKLTESL